MSPADKRRKRREQIVLFELDLRALVKRAISEHGRNWLRSEVPLGYTHDRVAAGTDPGMHLETTQAELSALRLHARKVLDAHDVGDLGLIELALDGLQTILGGDG